MSELLVGSTGFVGGNLMRAHKFDKCVHSTNVNESFSMKPDLCVYAGVPSAMYIANSDPDKDLSIIENAIENICRIRPHKLVLISTVAVYSDTCNKSELYKSDEASLSAYGRNRLILEEQVREKFNDVIIVRLPALYGYNLKKNFIYDLHEIVPRLLSKEKYQELSVNSQLISTSYSLNQNGYYEKQVTADQKALYEYFKTNGFNALSFTDSRSSFQFYDVRKLWEDLSLLIENEVDLCNLVTEPITAKELYENYTKKDNWNNELNGIPYDYDLRTIHADLFNGKNGYICNKEDVLMNICTYLENWK